MPTLFEQGYEIGYKHGFNDGIIDAAKGLPASTTPPKNAESYHEHPPSPIDPATYQTDTGSVQKWRDGFAAGFLDGYANGYAQNVVKADPKAQEGREKLATPILFDRPESSRVEQGAEPGTEPEKPADSSSSATPWIVGGVAVAALGVGYYLFTERKAQANPVGGDDEWFGYVPDRSPTGHAVAQFVRGRGPKPANLYDTKKAAIAAAKRKWRCLPNPVGGGQVLEWGLQPKGDFVAAWGTRALYHDQPSAYARRGYVFDILWDRQSSFGNEKDRKALESWLNKKGLPALRKALKSKSVRSSSNTEVEVSEGRFKLRASPRGSHGYLYMVATMA